MLEHSTKGYDLVQLSMNRWTITNHTDKTYSGTFKEVATYAVNTLSFKTTEIEFALEQMLRNDHNTAHFGMGKMFIFSVKREY